MLPAGGSPIQLWLLSLGPELPCRSNSTASTREATGDTLAERLRRRPAKPVGSARMGSAPQVSYLHL